MTRRPAGPETRDPRWRGVALALPFAVGLAAVGCTSGSDAGEEEDAAAQLASWVGPAPAGDWTGATDVQAFPDEPRFRRLTKLTNAGTNAEAYFSTEGDRLVFQATWPGVSECDQMYTMALDGSDLQRVSTGEGRTTCGFYFPDQDILLFSSTHLSGPACPPAPDRSRGYLWGLFEYDIFTRDVRTGEVQQLTNSPGYDAEGTLSPNGSQIVFTSTRSGDLDIWLMNADGSNPRQLTSDVGYEGGPVFSWDGAKIVYRASRPETPEEIASYQALLAEDLVAGSALEIFVMDVDGSNKRQVTSNGAANFAPAFLPDGRRIIYSSNQGDPSGRTFALYLINEDGTGEERVTTSEAPTFNSFPMLSPDGRYLAFSSDRGAAGPGEINVFLAEWVDPLPAGAP